MSENSERGSRFWILLVVRSSFAVLRRNVILFVLLVVVLALFSVVLTATFERLQESLKTADTETMATQVLVLGKVLFEIMLLKVALVYCTAETLAGRPPSIARISTRLKSLRLTTAAVRVLGISLAYLALGLALLAIMVGAILTSSFGNDLFALVYFVVAVCAGFMALFSKYYIAIPVAVIESRTIIASLTRSSDLTRGFKWKIFGLWCSLMFIVFPIYVTIELAHAGVLGPDMEGGENGSLPANAYLFLEAFGGSLFAVLDGVATTVAYVHLREMESGRDAGRVFAMSRLG